MTIASHWRFIVIAGLIVLEILAIRSNPLIAALVFIPTVGVVCGKKTQAAGTVSSAKTAKPEVEEWVPEVEVPHAALTELPIETIEGIGPVYGQKLRDNGISTVQELLTASAEEVAKICGVGEDEAQRWISMSRFAWLESVSEEDAEAIVYAGGIGSLKELSEADPEQLLKDILEGVKLGHVQIPKGYEFTLENVKKWIAEAKDLITE
ncbi:MAG: DUF4332 domain-containing protein [Candidatus Thorarchaeota archaeon]